MCRSSTTSLASATIEKEIVPSSMEDSIHSTGTMNELLNTTLPTPDNSKYTFSKHLTTLFRKVLCDKSVFE